MTEQKKCGGGIVITDQPCPKCGARESDLCGEIDGTVYADGLTILSLTDERDRLAVLNEKLADGLGELLREHQSLVLSIAHAMGHDTVAHPSIWVTKARAVLDEVAKS